MAASDRPRAMTVSRSCMHESFVSGYLVLKVTRGAYDCPDTVQMTLFETATHTGEQCCYQM